MDFEEFFRKKKIDLISLEHGEPALFSEFKIHFGQMGEKSFDHTKKYWFNKLRLRFPAPVEAKVEKVVIENQLAEQTVTESLIESSSPPPNIGFKPKFRAGLTKPAEESAQPKENIEEAVPAPTVGFKPRFKAGVTKPVEPIPDTTPEKPAENTEQTTPAANIGFKPRFKAGVTKPAETTSDTPPAPEKPAESTEQTTPPANIGFKPRFKAGVTKPAEPSPVPEKPAEDATQSAPPAPLGFKPKFKAGVTKTVAPAPEKTEETKAEDPLPDDQSPENNEAQPAYKPRFNMKNMKSKGEE